jgi:hypothetical protein
MIKGFLNISWFIWADLALIIAVIYSVLWPRKAANGGSGFRYLVLRWGHALTWILLAVSFLLRGLSTSLTATANFAALIGGLTFVLFLVMTFVVK